MIRMKWAIEEITGIPYADLDCYCVGEHGKAIRLYDQATVKGKPLVLTDEQKAIVEKMNVEWFAHWQSLKSGRTTGWTSSIHIAKIIKAIVEDSKIILPAATVLLGEFGLSDVALDMVCRIGKDGIEEIIDPEFSEEQMKELKTTAERMLGQEAQIGLV
jgi:malate/lactate dehydrogenase